MPITSTWRVVNTNNSSVRWDLNTTAPEVVSSVNTASNASNASNASYTGTSSGTSTYYYNEENMKNWNDRFEYYLGAAFKKKVKFIQEEFDV